MKWMNLPEEFSRGEFVVLPISYEKNVTYGGGTARGAAAIIEASKHLEYYDSRLDAEAFGTGIETLEEMKLSLVTPEEMVEMIRGKVIALGKKFVVSLGGDHGVTIGIVKGLEQTHGDDFSIVQFDAHADFRDSWNGSSLNHACVSRQISKRHSLLNIGVRSMDIDEKKLMDGCSNVHIVKAHEFDLAKIQKLLHNLNKKVYITIDVDAFDPSFIRNTGTPEPGGLNWEQVVRVLEMVFSCKNVISCDIVEFAPKMNFEAEAYALAKLAYRLMGLKMRGLVE